MRGELTICELMDEIMTMDPGSLRSTQSAAAAWQVLKTPKTFTSNLRSIVEGQREQATKIRTRTYTFLKSAASSSSAGLTIEIPEFW